MAGMTTAAAASLPLLPHSVCLFVYVYVCACVRTRVSSIAAVNRCRVQHCNHNPPGRCGSLSLTHEIYLLSASLPPLPSSFSSSSPPVLLFLFLQPSSSSSSQISLFSPPPPPLSPSRSLPPPAGGRAFRRSLAITAQNDLARGAADGLLSPSSPGADPDRYLVRSKL